MMRERKFFLRNARPEDFRLIYEWANDPETRRNSFSTHTITPDEHKAWYENVMNSDDTRLFIMVYEGKDVGQIRIKIKDGSAEISYSVAPDFRRLGYGKIMLSLAVQKIKAEFPEIKILTAQVKTDNIASRKALLGVGFAEQYSVFRLNVSDFSSDSVNMDSFDL